jgi:predicted metal-binding membrane protein
MTQAVKTEAAVKIAMPPKIESMKPRHRPLMICLLLQICVLGLAQADRSFHFLGLAPRIWAVLIIAATSAPASLGLILLFAKLGDIAKRRSK